MSKIFTKPFRPLDWAATPHDFSGDYQLGPYTVESTQRFVYGTRYLTWDGRVFKYYNAEGATYSYHAACRIAAASACAVYANAPVVTLIGDRSLTWTTQGSDRVEDDLAGGFVLIYDKSSTDGNVVRAIVGNDASVGTTTRIFLEYPLEFAIEITTPDAIELFENPYGDLSEANNDFSPWMGVPTTNATAGQKGWIQTWGPVVVSGSASIGSPAVGERQLVFGCNATLFTNKERDDGTYGYQHAGYNLVVGSTGYGPLFMLQCST